MIIKEIFPTLQGEGSKAGRPAVFIRLAGCNLWSGKEAGRSTGKGTCALWCDTDFVGGTKYNTQELWETVNNLMQGWAAPFVVITGGEPGLQLQKPENRETVTFLLERDVAVAVETNGTISCVAFDLLMDFPNGHLTVSPKMLGNDIESLHHIVQRRGTDLKVVVPSEAALHLSEMDTWDFEHKYIQPLDIGDTGSEALPSCMGVAQGLGWSVSVQTHKLIGLP